MLKNWWSLNPGGRGDGALKVVTKNSSPKVKKIIIRDIHYTIDYILKQ